ncbi:hypothetical protein FQA39_LY10205 [Lamprigera yunnana]|nr:hypothetical protein FQA39_LY10205 [Lamprigera yunnana]
MNEKSVGETIGDIYKRLCRALSANAVDVASVSKEFSLLQSNSLRIDFAYRLLHDYGLFPKCKLANKLTSVAGELREAGNVYFKFKQYNAALLKYSESVAYAPQNSEEMGLAFANRSAVLFHLKLYKECLEDVARALSGKYPPHLCDKLLRRREKAEVMKSGQSETEYHQNVPELSNGPNEFIECASNGVRLGYDDKNGRHVVSVENISAGDVVAIEKPFAQILLKHKYLSHCYNCLRPSYNLIPCEYCPLVLFCNEGCKRSAWESYHKHECPILSTLLDLDVNKLTLLALKICILVDGKGIGSDCALIESKYKSQNYTEIHNLIANTHLRPTSDLFDRSVTAAVIFELVQENSSLFVDAAGKDAFKELLLLHIQIAASNFHEISETVNNDSFYQLDEHGSGAYSFLSLINHSCCPNVIRHCYGTTIVLRTLRPIRKGEQLYDNYGYHHAVMTKSERKERLYKQYFFDCQCEACSENWPLYTELPERQFNLRVTLEQIESLKNGSVEVAQDVLRYLLDAVKDLEELRPCKELANAQEILKQCYASFGNHEFDYKPRGIVPFLKAIKFPMVAANVDFLTDPEYRSVTVPKSYVVNVSGRKIGVIGYVLPSTAFISSPGEATFADEIETIKKESERLDKEGVKIIIALGHSGFEKDKEIAKAVPLVDVVVGGHTNTFLWNGVRPDLEVPTGPYPTIVEQVNGKRVPVVQAYAYTKYMGRLNVTFDDNGNLIDFGGQPQLLDSSVPQHKEALSLLETYRSAVNNIYNEVIGRTRVVLDGNVSNCRVKECNLANLITDAYVAYHSSRYVGKYWTDAPVAIFNAGAIRNSVTPRLVNGSLTKYDIISALPYDDNLYTISLNGTELKQTLEIGVRYNNDTNRGELIHASGLHYGINMSKPIGSRIAFAKIRCGSCDIPTYEHMVMNKTYRVIVTGFLLKGGDGHKVIKTRAVNLVEEDKTDSEILAWYINKKSPLLTEEDERVTFGNHDFDYGVVGVVPFLNAINFPLVAANMDFSKEPQLLATNVTKSYVLEVHGVKIGVIGYLTPDTAEQSTSEKVIFSDEVDSVKQESERLDKEGIKIIIALGHSGYEMDKKIAKKVPLVDIVVGGHTNTFLHSGPQPDLETPEGPYPTIVTQDSGKKVPVVQAYGLTKYLGRLLVVFNEDGDLVETEGEAQLLDRSVPQDEDALALLDTFRVAVEALETEVIGLTRVELDGDLFKCRLSECNIANLITDAIFAYHLLKYDGPYWTDASISLINAGCIRNGVDYKFNGSITKADILAAIPFDDVVYSMDVTGNDLLETLEIGVRGNGDASSGEAIHSSGIRYIYDRSKQVGFRILEAKVRCTICKIPKYENISKDKTYKILLNGFLSKGGDGHDVLKKNGYNRVMEDKTIWEILEWYIRKTTPIYPQEEGNHEFDYDVAGLLPFLHAVNFPIVTANLNLSRERELEESELKKSYVMEISGHKIGVIGYLLPDTVQLASTSNVIFLDEVSAIKEESERLNKNGVKIIIALGHSGYKKDLEIARNVPLVDLVVGGHSNTFLWNGAKPDDEEIEGPYPITVKQASGKDVPVVHAYAFTKYMGRLSVEFDEKGNLVEYAGQPMLLDNHVDQEVEALVLLEKYIDELKELMSESLGETKVLLDGRVEVCRREECSIGNFISDAFVRYHAEMYKGMYWTDASIALYNSGSIRNSIDPRNGNITKESLLYAFPYTDLVCTLTLNGSDLLKTLEIGVRGNGETSYGEFLQVSGIKYQIDRSRPPGSRVLEAKARCAACSIPQYQIIHPQKSYKIITRQFLCNGGDGFSVLKDNAYDKAMMSVTEFDIAVWYINRTSPIYIGNEERIVIVEHSANSASLLTVTISLFNLITFSFGNHEFDFNKTGLLPFLKHISFPIVAANMNFALEPEYLKINISKSIVLDIQGHKIGVIGYLTPDTVHLAETENIVFRDEVDAIKEESEMLHRNGVNIIIALGHSGFITDKKIAKEVPLVDLVIGGHTNTFLYSGSKPDLEEPEGLYPTLIEQINGKVVPVVQAFAFTKYIGRLLLTFDDAGDLVEVSGQPQLLDSSIKQDDEALELLDTFKPEMQYLFKTIGTSKVLLDGSEQSCRHRECNFGNLVTDSFVAYHAANYDGAYWTDAPISLLNGGTLRSSIESGDVTVRDLYEVIPYKDKIVSMSLNGSTLLDVLEHSVRSNGETSFGEFLQTSGLHYSFNRTRPVGFRILKAKVRCGLCRIPVYEPLVLDKTYRIITRRFLSTGGDNYSMLKYKAYDKCFGNHEFAYKPSGLAPFLNAINFPIVATNLDFSNEPALSSYGITKSWIFEIEGKRIGVIGYLTPLTTVMSYVGNVKFKEEIPAITLESERLRNASVKTIIALGHSGYKIDQKIAAQVPLVDLVIGGHTNTFLWNGAQIDLEVPQGPYPTLVTQPNGKIVPVVQAYAYTKYMGRLSIIINDKGEIIYFNGMPQLLNSTVPQEEDALNLLNKYRVELDIAETTVVGSSDSVLVGEIKQCRYKECTLANLITDAFVLYYKLHYGLNSIGVISSRTPYHSIIPGENGTITMFDMLNALPYGGNVYSTILTGADIWKSLEIGVRTNGDTTGAEFLHTSGIQYGYNKSESLGSRIKFVKVRCYECKNLTYVDIDLTSQYRIVTTEFLINGLDEHTVIKNNGMNTTVANKTEMDVILWYIKKNLPLNVKLEARVTILSQ